MFHKKYLTITIICVVTLLLYIMTGKFVSPNVTGKF